MVSILLFYLILSSGSVFAAARWGRRYEETLPVTCATVVLVLLLSGVAGDLRPGMVLLCLLAAAAYIWAGLTARRAAAWKELAGRIFTPAFFVLLCVSALLLYITFGKMAEAWDEFTRWMDIVKWMVLRSTLGTEPGADLSFAAYPPGMALFQFFFEKLYQWSGAGTLSEWRAFFAYHVLDAVFLLPFLKELPKKPLPILAAAAAVFLAPLPFNGICYSTIYMEAHLSFLFGAGMAMLFLGKAGDPYTAVYLACVCALLVLAKDAGLLPAAVLLFAYLVLLWSGLDRAEKQAPSRRAKCLLSALTAGGVLLPYALWHLRLALDHTGRAFSTPYDPGLILRVVLGLDDSYRAAAWRYYWQEFVHRPVRQELSYAMLLAPLLLLVCMFAWLLVRKGILRRGKAVFLTACTALQLVLFITGLGITYITSFGAGAAARLDSFERYLSIPFCGCWILLAAFALNFFGSRGIWRAAAYGFAAVLAVLGFAMDFGAAYYLGRVPVKNSIAQRAVFDDMARQIVDAVPENARLCLVSQGDEGYDFWVLRYLVRPGHIAGEYTLNTGGEGELASPAQNEEWRERFLRDFDYVALYRLDEGFADTFAGLFAEPDAIRAGRLYRVDAQQKRLLPCDA